MSINKITNVKTNYNSKDTYNSIKENNRYLDSVNNAKKESSSAAVYEKGSLDSQKVYKRDNTTINRLWEEAEQREQGLRNLVEKMLLKQGETFSDATNIYSLLREGKLDVDPEIRTQAQKDIAQNGYWGVEQTAMRLVSFAKGLTRGDAAKADLMISAVKKGFNQAKEAWGGELPGICKSTIERAISELEQWRDQGSENEEI